MLITSIHEGKKPFRYDTNRWDYKFSLQSHMNKHVESVHERKKPFNCDYSCSQKSKMNKHVVSVHEGEKPFECDICDYSCSLKSKMNKLLCQCMKERNHSEFMKERKKAFK